MNRSNAQNETVVIVEDDKEIVRLTQMLLESEGYRCHAVLNGLDAISVIREVQPDLVLLDVMLPGRSGVEVCNELRSFYDGGVLMLTGCDDDITELSSFKSGADDYVIKPIKPHLLLARIKALLNRTSLRNTEASAEKPKRSNMHFGDIEIDPSHRKVSIAGDDLSLTDAEYDLLELLAIDAGTILSREHCCAKLRGLDYDGMDRSIDMRISSLRKKLSAYPQHIDRILTVRGQGYMMVIA